MTAEGSHHLIELIHQIFHHTNPRREVPEILFSKPWIQPRPRKWPSSQETPAVRNRIVISVHQNRQFLAEIFFAGGSDAQLPPCPSLRSARTRYSAACQTHFRPHRRHLPRAILPWESLHAL